MKQNRDETTDTRAKTKHFWKKKDFKNEKLSTWKAKGILGERLKIKRRRFVNRNGNCVKQLHEHEYTFCGIEKT